jgi:hypothetical protein
MLHTELRKPQFQSTLLMILYTFYIIIIITTLVKYIYFSHLGLL